MGKWKYSPVFKSRIDELKGLLHRSCEEPPITKKIHLFALFGLLWCEGLKTSMRTQARLFDILGLCIFLVTEW